MRAVTQKAEVHSKEGPLEQSFEYNAANAVVIRISAQSIDEFLLRFLQVGIRGISFLLASPSLFHGSLLFLSPFRVTSRTNSLMMLRSFRVFVVFYVASSQILVPLKFKLGLREK